MDRRSRKHKLSCHRTDSQDLSNSGDTSSHIGNSATWEESDEINTYITHQLSTLSIPRSSYHQSCDHSGHEHPPRKKIKRRKSRRVKRSRVKSAIHISESSDVTPTSPTLSNMKNNTSDDTVAEAMSTGGNSSDSSISLGYLTDIGGAEADDELSCWEGPCTTSIFHSEEEGADKTEERLSHYTSPLKPETKTTKREKLKTRHKPAAKEAKNGGSSTSSPSMAVERAKRHYLMDYMAVGGNPGPSSMMGE